MLATTANPAAGLKTGLDTGHHFSEARRTSQRQSQRSGIALDGLGRLGQAAVRILPTTHEQEPVLQEQGQHFGVEFTHLPPGLGAARFIQAAQTRATSLKSSSICQRARSSTSASSRVSRSLGTEVTRIVQAARAKCCWLTVCPLRLASWRSRRRRCSATWGGTGTARSRAGKRS